MYRWGSGVAVRYRKSGRIVGVDLDLDLHVHIPWYKCIGKTIYACIIMVFDSARNYKKFLLIDF